MSMLTLKVFWGSELVQKSKENSCPERSRLGNYSSKGCSPERSRLGYSPSLTRGLKSQKWIQPRTITPGLLSQPHKGPASQGASNLKVDLAQNDHVWAKCSSQWTKPRRGLGSVSQSKISHLKRIKGRVGGKILPRAKSRVERQ